MMQSAYDLFSHILPCVILLTRASRSFLNFSRVALSSGLVETGLSESSLRRSLSLLRLRSLSSRLPRSLSLSLSLLLDL